MNLDTLRNSLVLHEGRRALPYRDTKGNWTVGVGHNLNSPMTKKKQDGLLMLDIEEAIDELDRAFKGWRDHPEKVQHTLIELCFMMGAPTLSEFVSMWKALDSNDYQSAAEELLDSRMARNHEKWGSDRVKALADQMRAG